MKKILSCVFVVVFALSCFALTAQAASPGSTTTTAMAIELGRTYSGTIGKGQGRYFYKYTLPSSGRLIIKFFSPDIYKVLLYTYNNNANPVFYDYIYQNSVSGTIDVSCVKDLVSGTYYLCIDRESYDGSYSFSVNVETVNESFRESLYQADNTTTQANQIDFGKTYTGQIAYNDTVDYYKLVVSSAITVPFAVDSNQLQGVTVYLYDSDSKALWYRHLDYNEHSGLLDYDSTISFASPGIYYISFNRRSKTGAYSFSVGEVAPTSYTVTFNGNGGTPSLVTQKVNAGTSITLPSASRSGYRFLGWSEMFTATEPSYKAGDGYTVTKNVTLYAVWAYDPTPTQYTVRFDMNGGSPAIPETTASPGDSIVLPKPTRSGCKFLGWYENVDGTAHTYGAGESYTVTHDATLRALWEKEQSSILVLLTNLLNNINWAWFRDLVTAILNWILRIFATLGN